MFFAKFAFVLTLIVKCIFGQVVPDDMACDLNNRHMTLSSGRTCCNNTSILSAINAKGQNWVECQSIASAEGETLPNAFWRVYTCALSKALPEGQNTISLSSFAQLVTKEYPAEIKDGINRLVAVVSASWLTSDIPLTDFAAVDKIRAQYYDIETQVCEDKADLKLEISKEKVWNTCSYYNESFHRDADCCGNYPIPFKYNVKSPAYQFQPAAETCAKTLDQLLQKFGSDDEVKQTVLAICRIGCYLVDKTFLTITDLLNLRTPNAPPMETILKGAFPYLPSTAMKTLAEKSNRDYNGTTIMDDLSEFLIKFNSTVLMDKQDVLYACYAVNNVFETSTFSESCEE